jgi:excinuclease ABC subunit B
VFDLQSPYHPSGDQPQAIEKLSARLVSGDKDQVLLGVTGSGKTYTIANVIKEVQRPTLVISHNKTLAAQLFQEFRDFFPNNAVEYFVSYYDYFQPESYLPATDTYIEKDSDINEKIEKLRLAATTSLMTRKDVIVISSVSCIYNLGSPEMYSSMAVRLLAGMKMRSLDFMTRLSQINYERSDIDFKRGTYRVIGDIVDVFLAYQDFALRVEFLDNKVVNITSFDPVTASDIESKIQSVDIYPAKHYVTPLDRTKTVVEEIKRDLDLRVQELKKMDKKLEAYRLEQRTNYDLEMMQEIGYCKGIENYSRYFDNRAPGSTPYTLMDFFPKDYLLIIDESHITVPQVRGMYNGDQARKRTLIDYGFRLPSALDNRPLNFDEFLGKVGQTIFVSATPNEWEIERSHGEITELLVRPTGILDPKVTILPIKDQVKDLLGRIKERVARKERTLVTTLTKRMAEELSTYLLEQNIKVTYLHSDVDTLERTEILDDLRKGSYDVLVGINLLREGLDLPEVSLVAILDADKEGFLRSDTALIQTMGRAARHILGEVVMYADRVTDSMKRAIAEVDRRRAIQEAYNIEHGITPEKISKPFRDRVIEEDPEAEIDPKAKKSMIDVDYLQLPPAELKKAIKALEKEMIYEAEVLNFEKAASLRDKIREIKRSE